MWPTDAIEKTLKLCSDRLYRPRSSQPPYNALNREFEAMFPLCQKAGIGQVVYSPLAQGVLSGKYKPGQPLPEGSRATDPRQNQFINRYLDDATVLKKVQRLAPIAEEHHLTMSQLALAWILRRAEVTSCIIGATRPEQIEQNVEASGVKLDEATIRRIDDLLG